MCPEYFCNCIPPMDQIWSLDNGYRTNFCTIGFTMSPDEDDYVDQKAIEFDDPLIEYDQLGFRRLPHVPLKQQPVTMVDKIFIDTGCISFQEFLERQGNEYRTENVRRSVKSCDAPVMRAETWRAWQHLNIKQTIYLPDYIKSKYRSAEEIASLKNLVAPALESKQKRRRNNFEFYLYEFEDESTSRRKIAFRQIWGTLERGLKDGYMRNARRSVWLQKKLFDNHKLPFVQERRLEMQSNQLLRSVTFRHKTHLHWMVKDGFKSTLAMTTSVDDFEAESENAVEIELEKMLKAREIGDSSDESDEDEGNDKDQRAVRN